MRPSRSRIKRSLYHRLEISTFQVPPLSHLRLAAHIGSIMMKDGDSITVYEDVEEGEATLTRDGFGCLGQIKNLGSILMWSKDYTIRLRLRLVRFKINWFSSFVTVLYY